MELQLNVYNLLILFGTLQALVFGTILLWESSFKDAHKYLGICVLFLSGYLLWVLKADVGIQEYIPELRYLPLLFLWGIGPSFYTYLRFFFRKPLSSNQLRWIFSPILIELAYFNSRTLIYWLNGWEFAAMSAFEKSWVLNVFSVEHYIGFVSIAIYLFMSMRLLREQRKTVFNKKIFYILICFSALVLIWLPYTIIDSVYYEFNFPISEFYFFYISFTVLTYSIGFIGFRLNMQIVNKKTFENSLELQELSKVIEHKMANEKYYLDPDLNIKTFALKVELHPNKISAILNNIINQSFREYVNSYRMIEFKTRLGTYDLHNYNIISLSYECGFNSKASFHRVFKKHTGCTPVEYLKKIQNNESQNT